ncbi:uncharacterized protein LOC105694232 isoform X2 [Orussus abietinus]|uniref:uncharacterized protein LOC105694232 isoform X2 n=1 Tax=Orussus abietinus TaxID=222816 RepID=UPI000626554E|nr:uncharacterized protein LOC105694232 isoform X2 [Orussus abietinus]
MDLDNLQQETKMDMEDTDVTGKAWYTKLFEYVRNHNRIDPGRLELPDCDFFNVAPRRTLRILKPPIKNGEYYEGSNERPDSVNGNFFSRWSKRPHPSGNCRCSFRRSNRFSTTEEQLLSAELNHIRNSLSEAEMNGENIEQLEKTVSVNLEGLIPPVPEENDKITEKKLTDITEFTPGTNYQNIDEVAIKSKIVKDLEKFIEELLEEIVDDTLKYISESKDVINRVENCSTGVCTDPKHLSNCVSFENDSVKLSKITDEKQFANSSCTASTPFNKINFAFHNDINRVNNEEVDYTDGYVNHAFLGSSNDPDTLEFYLHKPVNSCMALEHLDCIDSGINSVETIEFQPEQEPSLEESLMEIIDAKLGRSPLRKSWEDLRDQQDKDKTIKESICEDSSQLENHESPCNSESQLDSEVKVHETLKDERDLEEEINTFKKHETVTMQNDNQNALTTKIVDWEKNTLESVTEDDSKKLNEVTTDPNFDQLRLEFNGSSTSLENIPPRKKKGMHVFCRKLSTSLCTSNNDEDKDKRINVGPTKRNDSSRIRPVELEDYRKKWSSPKKIPDSTLENNLRDSVKLRKNKKPIIVFLHGFGASADVFAHQLEYFSKLGYPCLAPDMLGHGMSSAPNRSRDYHFEKLLKDLDTILHHYAFKPGHKCVLVAHNYGCSFATALACKYDTNIHRLVLISGGGPTPLAPPSTETRGRQHPYCGPESPEQWPSHMKYILEGMVWPEGDYVFHRRICTPTLLVHGLRDNKVSLVQECQMERTMVKAFLEAIPAAGHCPMTDCPEQLNHMIHCFIDLWKHKKW